MISIKSSLVHFRLYGSECSAHCVVWKLNGRGWAAWFRVGVAGRPGSGERGWEAWFRVGWAVTDELMDHSSVFPAHIKAMEPSGE